MATAPPEGSFLRIFSFEIPLMFFKAGQGIIMLDSEFLYQRNILYINHILCEFNFFHHLTIFSLISRVIEKCHVTEFNESEKPF